MTDDSSPSPADDPANTAGHDGDQTIDIPASKSLDLRAAVDSAAGRSATSEDDHATTPPSGGELLSADSHAAPRADHGDAARLLGRAAAAGRLMSTGQPGDSGRPRLRIAAGILSLFMAVSLPLMVVDKKLPRGMIWLNGAVVALFGSYALRGNKGLPKLFVRNARDALTTGWQHPLAGSETDEPFHAIRLTPSTVPAAGDEPTPRTFTDVSEVGNRPSLVGTALLGLTAAVIAAYACRARHVVAPSAVIVLILSYLTLRMWCYFRPPRLSVAGGTFSLQRTLQTIVTDAANVLDIRQVGGHTLLTFANLDDVAPFNLRKMMAKTAAARGFHVMIVGPSFTLDQTARISAALGLPPAPVDQTTAEAADFAQRLETLTPHVFMTPAIIAINIVLYAAMILDDAASMDPPVATLVRWGANGPQTFEDQWWRLLACMFLHAGPLHLAINMQVLWRLGRLMERVVGNAGFAVIYFISGLAGSVTSLVWQPDAVSVGASGAVFGVCGALLGFLGPRGGGVDPVVLQRLKGSLASFVVYNLLIGSFVPAIDMAAHFGGLAAGFLCGLVMRQPVSAESKVDRWWRNATCAVGAAVVLPFAITLLPMIKPRDLPAELTKIGEIEERVLERFQSVMARFQSGDLPDEEFVDFLQREILPPWREARDRLGSIMDAPSANTEMLRTVSQSMLLRETGWQLLVEGFRDGDPGKTELFTKNWEEANRVLESMQQGP